MESTLKRRKVGEGFWAAGCSGARISCRTNISENFRCFSCLGPNFYIPAKLRRNEIPFSVFPLKDRPSRGKASKWISYALRKYGEVCSTGMETILGCGMPPSPRNNSCVVTAMELCSLCMVWFEWDDAKAKTNERSMAFVSTMACWLFPILMPWSSRTELRAENFAGKPLV